jgi:hypothetical protein
MRLTRLRQQIPTVIIISCLLLNSACGGSVLLKSFRVALASSGPLVNALAASGAIPQSKVTAIIADFDAGASCALTLQQAFDASKSLPKDEQRRARFAAASESLRCWRVIIERQNFAVNSRVKQIADIAEGVLQSLVIFYSDTPIATATRGAARVKDEDALEKQLKVKVDEMERLLKP